MTRLSNYLLCTSNYVLITTSNQDSNEKTKHSMKFNSNLAKVEVNTNIYFNCILLLALLPSSVQKSIERGS